MHYYQHIFTEILNHLFHLLDQRSQLPNLIIKFLSSTKFINLSYNYSHPKLLKTHKSFSFQITEMDEAAITVPSTHSSVTRFTGYSSAGGRMEKREKGLEIHSRFTGFRAISDHNQHMLDDNFHLLVEKNSFTQVRKLVGQRDISRVYETQPDFARRTMQGKATFFPS